MTTTSPLPSAPLAPAQPLPQAPPAPPPAAIPTASLVNAILGDNPVLAARSASTRRKPSDRRIELREQLWPDSHELVWSRKDNDGFVAIPRLLPLVMKLIGLLAKRGNPGRAYLALWLRSFDEGLVSISDEQAVSYEAGYDGTRAVRTYREHLETLQELKFIRIAPDGIREYGHVLLLNPITVFVHYRRNGKVTDELWGAFLRRASEVGARIPKDPAAS